MKQHKPLCMANVSCAVIHPDGICSGPYGKCTCDEIPTAPMTNTDKDEKIPCDCPKGGMDIDGRVCTKCGGMEWVTATPKVTTADMEEKCQNPVDNMN